MATPTPEEIEKKEEAVQKLREKLADAQAKEADNILAIEREVRLAALEAEEERLQRELDVQQERAKKTVVREGTERLGEQAATTVPTNVPAATSKEG